ncbi:MAG: hypothetical protein GWP05_04900 [Anaerolineaceae bacterium]|nr:hypothetical protein [Anaerolineaceae bacterium]
MTRTHDASEAPGSLPYEPRIVAFLDILGFRSFVSQGYLDAVAKMKAMDDALEHTLRFLREEEREEWVSIRTFSDCMCLSAAEEYLPTFIDAVATLQYDLAIRGIFVRGGISAGYHCETSRMIFSQGLVLAYELQVHDPYPRVLVASEVVQKMLSLSLSRGVCCVGVSVDLAEYLLIDSTSACFLDYLRAFAITECSEFDEFLTDHAESIANQLIEHKNEQHVLDKFVWLAAYHNFRFEEAFDPDDWYPDYFDKLKENSTVPLSILTAADNEAVQRMQFSRLQVAKDS